MVEFIPNSGIEFIPNEDGISDLSDPLALLDHAPALTATWVGRPLNTPIQDLPNGQAYLDLVEKNERGRRGIFEELTDPEISEVAFVGPFFEIPYMLGVAKTAKKLNKGEDVTDQELLDLNQYIEFSKRKDQASRGSKVVNLLQNSLAYGLEIGASFILAGLLAPEPLTTAVGVGIGAKTIGKKAATATARSAVRKFLARNVGAAAKKAISRLSGSRAGALATRGFLMTEALGESAELAVKKAVTKRFGATVGKYVGKIAGVGANLESKALVNQLFNPQRTVRSMAQRRLDNAMRAGDESVTESVAKGFMDMNFEYASEFSGRYIGAVARRLLPAKAVKRLGESALFQWISQTRGVNDATGAWKVLNTVGVNGMLEEMGEERVGDFLRGLFGVQGDAGLVNAIKQSWPSGEQFAIEAIGFSVMPIIANGANRIAGGVGASEYAANLELLKRVGQQDPNVFVKTEGQLRQEATELHRKLREESEPWYADTGLAFLSKIFGEERRGSLQSLLTRKGVANLKTVHDEAVKKDPKNPDAGIDTIAGFLGMLQGVHSEGIATDKDLELFNAGVKSGDIVQKSFGNIRKFFVRQEALTDKDIQRLQRKTGIAAIVEVDMREENTRIGEIDPLGFVKEWGQLTTEERDNFKLRWHSKDSAYLEKKYNTYKKILETPDLGISLFEAVPAVYVGTAEQFAGETGYQIPPGAAVYDTKDGKKRFAMYRGAMTNADGTEIDISTHASEISFMEDLIEAKLKQESGLNLTPAINSWVDTVRRDLQDKKGKTDTDKRVLNMLSSESGRFEFAVKTYMLNTLGYDTHEDLDIHSKQLVDIAVTPEAQQSFQMVIGEALLENISLTELKAREVGPGEARVRELTGERGAGRTAKAREIVAQAQEDALITKLGDALALDQRKAESRTAVQGALDVIEQSGTTFSLVEGIDAQNEFNDLKRAVELGTDEAINRAAKHWLLKISGRPEPQEKVIEEPRRVELGKGSQRRGLDVAETRTPEGGSIRRDREAPYPTPEEFKALFSEDELRAVAPEWLQGEPLEAWLEDFTESDYEQIVRDAANQLEDPPSIEQMISDLQSIPPRLLRSSERFQPGRRPESRIVEIRGRTRLAARSSVSAPFGPVVRTPLDLQQETVSAEEAIVIDENFGPDDALPTQAPVTRIFGESAQDLALQGEPRRFWEMDPLDNRALSEQVTALVPVGMAGISRYARQLADRMPNATYFDAVFIPDYAKYKNNEAWLRDVSKNQLRWNLDFVPHLNKGRKAIESEEVNVEGAVLVMDFGENSLENRLGLPMQRIMHDALNGAYPLGKGYQTWRSTRKRIEEGKDLGTIPMYYQIPVEGLREDLRASYPNGTTTLQLIIDGIRTATTRRSFGSVGDKFTLAGTEYIITKIKKVDLDTEAGKADWSSLEGWDADFAPKQRPSQVRTGATQTIFEKADTAGIVLGRSVTKLEREMDIDEILGEIEESPVVTDFLQRSQPAAFRAAVFPISTERLESITTDAQADQLAGEVHDWMVRNRIRRLMIGGIDQVQIRGEFEVKTKAGDTLVFDREQIVSPAWMPNFAKVMNKAMAIEVRKRRQDVPEAQPEVLDPATITGLEETLRAGGATFSLTSDDIVLGIVSDLEVRDVVVTSKTVEHGSYFETTIGDRFRAYSDGRVIWMEHPDNESMEITEFHLNEKYGIQDFRHLIAGDKTSIRTTSLPTFSLMDRTLDKMAELDNLGTYPGVRNLLPAATRTAYSTMVGRALAGDEAAKDYVARHLGDADRESFKGLYPLAQPVQPAEVAQPEVATGQDEFTFGEQTFEVEQDTQALEAITSLYDDISPAFASGATGFHKMMLDVSAKFRAIKFEETAFIDRFMSELGINERRKDLPEEHTAVVNVMLRGVGAILDGSTRIPIGWKDDGSIEWNDIPPKNYLTAWDTYLAANNIDMPGSEAVLKRMRDRYDNARNIANETLGQFTDGEWIRYVEDYINHDYRFKNEKDKKDAVRWMAEDSPRAKERRLPSYQVAAELKGWLPRTMNALELYKRWNSTVWSAARNKVLVNTASVVRDIDGAPIVIPIPYLDHPAGESQLVADVALEQTARHLASYLGESYNPAAGPAAEIHRLVGMMNTEEHDYTLQKSPLTKSVDHFLVRKGDVQNLMKNVLRYGAMDNKLVNYIIRYNAWSKFMMLSFSGFHPFALLESMSATFGLTLENPALPWNWKGTYQSLRGIVKDMKENPAKYAHWVSVGLMADIGNPDVNLGLIEKDMQNWLDKLEVKDNYTTKILTPAIKSFQIYKRWLDKHLWHEFHPAIKFYSAEFVYTKWKEDNPEAFEDSDREAREQIAEYINSAFGGQNWDQYIWATPQARQWLHLTFFAPDWSISAANVSGLTRLPILNKLHATNLSPLARDNMMRRYWPAMAAVVLFGMPNLVQALIYGVGGDPDEGDVPFTFMNEPGRGTYIDFTPIFRRLPGYDGDVSGKRRIYMRWGKQAYEIFEGWLGDPRMLLRKSSSAVRTAFEQVTGSTVSGWDLPFQDNGLMGTIAVDGSFKGSRAELVVKKFLPISLTSLAEGKPTAFIAPTAKGVSKGGVVYSMRQTLDAYVNRTSIPAALQGLDLEFVVAEIIEAARRNGIDPEIAFRQAKGSVVSKYYKKFFEALNKGDAGAMEDAAEKVLLLGRGLKDFNRSLKARYEAVGREFTPELAEAVRLSIDEARKK